MASASERMPLLSVNDVECEVDTQEKESTANGSARGEKNQLGTINGCYVPCLLNIMGIVLFMRLPWATGQAGLSGILGGIALAEAMALPTVLSLSAIVSNGNMEGGGSYYMISRSLGPELGGAIGLLFYLAYAIGVAFYIIGFSTELQSTIPAFSSCNHCLPNNSTPGLLGATKACITHSLAGHCVPGKFFIVSNEWTVAVIGSFSLLLCLAISLKGAGFFAKFNVIFFAVQMFATAWGIVSFLVPQTGVDPHGATTSITSNVTHFLPKYNVSFSIEHIRNNWEPQWGVSDQCLNENSEATRCNFRMMYAIIFPMATGIMEGANLSGDQKDPAHAIPTGTLWAVFTSCCTYIVLVVCFAGSFDRNTLVNDLNLFQNASLESPMIVITGILISSLSSGLGSLFGGSRVLQAIARDDLYPILKPFGYGSPRGDEPLVAVALTWVISQCCILIGNLDIVAPIITSIFCMSYALVNFTCLALSLSGAPNFRPMFKYWNKLTASIGFLVNIGVMFFLDFRHGAILCGALVLLIVYLTFRGPVTQWGDVSQALMFHQVRKYLLMLNERPHPKYWRPNLLLLVDDPNLGVIGFCNSIKKGGILVTGHVIIGELSKCFGMMRSIRAMWQNACREFRIKAFPHVTVASTARSGYQFLITCGGLGGLDINTVVIPLLRGLTRSPSGTSINNMITHSEKLGQLLPGGTIAPGELDVTSRGSASGKSSALDATPDSSLPPQVPLGDAATWCAVLDDAITAEKNLLITRNYGTKVNKSRKNWFGLPDSRGHVLGNDSDKTYIDIWIVDNWSFESFADDLRRCDQTVMLLFQFGQILNHKLRDNKHTLRILYVPSVSCLENHDMPVWNPCHGDLQGSATSLRDGLKAYCRRMRVSPGEVHVIDPRINDNGTTDDDESEPLWTPQSSLTARAAILNRIMKSYSADSTQAFLSLPVPPKGDDEEECGTYLEALRIVTQGLPPTALVYNGEHVSFVSSGI